MYAIIIIIIIFKIILFSVSVLANSYKTKLRYTVCIVKYSMSKSVHTTKGTVHLNVVVQEKIKLLVIHLIWYAHVWVCCWFYLDYICPKMPNFGV
jgi:hypothetical protein